MHSTVIHWQQKGHYFKYKGHDIFYIQEGTGPVLAIFHGYPYSSFDFEKIWDELTAQYTLVALDMLGMGFSDKPKDHSYSFEEMADLYAALFELLKINVIEILAHDLGNSVVQELIARDAQQKNNFTIHSIAFLNGGLFSDVYRPRLIQILLSKSPRPVGKILSKLMSKANVAKATAEVFGAQTKPDELLLDSWWDILNYKKGKSIAYLIGRLIFEKDTYQQRWIEAMQQTKIPLCFINGPADPNSGIHMVKRYEQLIPKPNIKLLQNQIGHWPQIEAPQAVLTAYAEFRMAMQ